MVGFVWFMVINAIFNNISGGQFYWWRKPEKNYRPVASH
jgi:hypothetical protein